MLKTWRGGRRPAHSTAPSPQGAGPDCGLGCGPGWGLSCELGRGLALGQACGAGGPVRYTGWAAAGLWDGPARPRATAANPNARATRRLAGDPSTPDNPSPSLVPRTPPRSPARRPTRPTPFSQPTAAPRAVAQGANFGGRQFSLNFLF